MNKSKSKSKGIRKTVTYVTFPGETEYSVIIIKKNKQKKPIGHWPNQYHESEAGLSVFLTYDRQGQCIIMYYIKGIIYLVAQKFHSSPLTHKKHSSWSCKKAWPCFLYYSLAPFCTSELMNQSRLRDKIP